MQETSGKNPYITLTGARLNLATLGDRERAFLDTCAAELAREPRWYAFAQFWRSRFRKAELRPNSILHRCCEDLEHRLGVQQGHLAFPGYRSQILESARERGMSLSELCKKSNVDLGHLSRVFSGDSELSIESLNRILDSLGLVLWTRRKDELEKDFRSAAHDNLDLLHSRPASR